MRRLAPAALLFACACASTSPPPAGAVRRHIVVITSDAVLIDFVAAHGSEALDQLTLNMGRNSNQDQAPPDFGPLTGLKSIQTLSLSGFTVKAAPGLTDAQVMSIAQIRTLRWLELRSLRLTDPQKRIFQTHLPQCEILEK